VALLTDGEWARQHLAGVDRKRCFGDGLGRGLAWEQEEATTRLMKGLWRCCGSRNAPASNYTHGREREGGGKGASGDARSEAKLRRWSESTKTRRSSGMTCGRAW
jgi:hypothetical protein